MKKIIKVLFILTVIFISSFGVARAVDTTTIHLDIETDSSSFSQDVNVTPCDSDNNQSTPDTITAYCALDQLEKSGILPTKSDWSGLWINSINGIANTDKIFWMWLVNLNIDNPYSDFKCHQDSPSGCSAKQYILNPNDNILFYYNINPLNISVSNSNPTVSDNITISVKELGLDGWNSVWIPSLGATVTLGTQSCTTISDGTCSIILDTSGSLTAIGSKTLYVPSPSINIEVSAPIHHSSGGSYIINPIKPTFDLKKAFDFLISQQKENGSFGEELYTDWAALALATGNYQEQTIKLVKYFGETKMSGTLLTDYERHAMALMTLGLNPYNANNENYIEKITAQFDGKQFGDVNEDNDDVFALIVLQNAGYTPEDKMISNDISFILNRQKDNGSWDESIDMTGATIESLSVFNQNEQVKNALIKAKEFLKQNQKDNGSWNNNASSTAWAMEGILASSEKPEDWIKNNNTPFDYFASNQNTDGGTKNEYLQNKIWETAYVASALSGKTWNQTMQKFNKIEMPAVIKIKAPVQKTETPKKIAKENIKPKLENLANQNTAKVVNTITESLVVTKIETPQKSWFRNLLDKIFSVF